MNEKKQFLISVLILFSVIVIIGCKRNLTKIDNTSISHLDIYHISDGIILPLGINQNEIKSEANKLKITDKDKIEEICKAIFLLDINSNAVFEDSGIYLTVDFYNDDKEVFRMLYDRNFF